MATRWHYQVHGRDIGPVDFATLQTMANEERLFVDDEIRPEDSDQWVLAETVPGLFTQSADEDDLSSMLAESDSADAPQERAGRDSWYCRTRNEEMGPLPFGRLVSLARDGKLARRDQVRHGLHGNWVEARSIEGLFEDAVAEKAAPEPGPELDHDSSMLESFEIVSDPTPVKPKAPRPPLEPILRMEDDDVRPVKAGDAPAAGNAAAAVADTEAEWSCRVLGQEIGPIGWDDLRELVELRQLGPNDRVRKGKSVAWVPAGTINDLFPKRKKGKAKKKKKKLSDDEVMDFLQPEEVEEPDEEEVASHVAPQRSFSRPAAKSSPAAPAKPSPAKSSPAIAAAAPAAESPAAPSPAAAPAAPRPDLAAAISAASAPPARGPRGPVPQREKRKMGNPLAGLGSSLSGIGDTVAYHWKPIAGVAVALLIGAGVFFGGGSLFPSSRGHKPNYYQMTNALWVEAKAVRTSKNQDAWKSYGMRYQSRIKMTAEKLSSDQDDSLSELLLTVYRDHLPKMIEAPIDGADSEWDAMEETMQEAESYL